MSYDRCIDTRTCSRREHVHATKVSMLGAKGIRTKDALNTSLHAFKIRVSG